MKRKGIRILTMLLAVMLVLSACGGNNSAPADSSGTPGGETNAPPTPGNGGEPIKDLVTFANAGTHEVENFFMIGTELGADLDVLCNAYSPLLEINNKGQLQPAVAKEWGTEDGGKTWTFKLRDDVTWVDVEGNEKAKCTAQDWVTAMEWILNFEKNGSTNTSMLKAMVEGAEEYYEYTKNLAETNPGAALALSTENNPEFDKVGIEAPDDYTLHYTCIDQYPYFDTLCTSAAMYSVSQAEIDEKGVENMIGMSNETAWYNGAYTITSYIMNNEKVLTRNPAYWDKDCTLFDTVTIIMIDDANRDDQLFDTGEVDHCSLSENGLKTILDNPSDARNQELTETRFRKYSFQYLINYAKNNEDGTPDVNWNTAVANENFRKSLYYGVNLENTWARVNPTNPMKLENLCFTMKGFLYFSDGTDYTDRVIEKLDNIRPYDGEHARRFNEQLGLEYRDKAIEELTAKGVTFPVGIDYYIKAGSATALDAATVLKENFERTLGSDYVSFNIKEYISSLGQEVRAPRLHSFTGTGWGADYGDVENFLEQTIYGYDGADFSMNYTNINDITDPDCIALFEEFTRMVQDAQTITDDMDARYEAFADAEAFLLNHALTIPSNYENSWQLTKINDYSKMYALYGCQNNTYKNWETSTVPYTAEDYARFEAEFNS